MKAFFDAGIKIIRNHYLALIFRLGLGTIFVVAGWSKIGHQSEMIQIVSGYNILPVDLVRPFAITLPWVELITGVLLIIGLMITSAGALLALVNLAFLIAVGTNLLRGTAVDCGCFGPGEQLSWDVFVRDIALLLMSLQVVFARPGQLVSTGGFLAPSPPFAADKAELFELPTDKFWQPIFDFPFPVKGSLIDFCVYFIYDQKRGEGRWTSRAISLTTANA